MFLPPRTAARTNSVLDEKQSQRVASLLDELISHHQGAITPDTPAKEFPFSNAIRVSEAGSFVWRSSSVKNLAEDLKHKIGFVGCEYVEEGKLTEPEEEGDTEKGVEMQFKAVHPDSEQLLEQEEEGGPSVLTFYMTYDAFHQRGKSSTAPRVGKVTVHEHDVLQFCGVEPGDDLNSVLTKTIRFIHPEMILTLLKQSVKTRRGIVLKVVSVGKYFADASENKELKAGDWILEARVDCEEGIEQWVAHSVRSDTSWLVRQFDERAIPHPPIPGYPVPPGLQAQEVHFDGREAESSYGCAEW
ncbi:hypothetical protein MD484_g4329, partial [Candolleomyces efflorescens]